MAKIENYTCDFCGVGVQSLVDLQALDIEMRSELSKVLMILVNISKK